MTEHTHKPPACHALDAIDRELWALTPDALRTMRQVAARTNTTEMRELAAAQKAAREERRALLLNGGQPLDGTRTAIVRNGVAIVPVYGSIFRRASFFTEFSGGATVDAIGNDVAAALRDPEVRAIILDIDSPGGQVSGINELAKTIFEARSSKPIVAYVGNLAASAGYWLASAATEIVIDETATLGSIGVIAYVPNPDADPDADPDRPSELEFRSTTAPKKNLSPTSDAGKDEIQQQIDALGDVFVESVARHRGVTTKKVLSDFGQGGVFVGQQAIAQGMADRIGTLEQVIAELTPRSSTSSSRARSTSRAQQENPMSIHANSDAPTPDAPAGDPTVAAIQARLAADGTLASLDPVAAVDRLLTEAQDGRAYRADLIAGALREGVRAYGTSFDEDTYRDMLAGASLDRIKKISADWQALGDKQLAGPRQSVDDDQQQPPTPQAAETPRQPFPTSVYAA